MEQQQLGFDLDDQEPATVEQLLLADMPISKTTLRAPVSLPSEVMRVLLDHEGTRSRYRAKVYQGQGDGCWYWIGALSSTGHGKLRAGPDGRNGPLVSAHVYGWGLVHGPVVARPGEDPVVAHRCDESSCQRPDHWELIERIVNSADYVRRRHHAEGPLADVRGAHGRAVAIRNAILAARTAGHDAETAIETAKAAGLTTSPSLF